MIKFTSTVFVDKQFGNDNTGQLDSLNFPFKTFDAAYLATTTQSEPYSILLASGSYDAKLDAYENISVEETNGSSISFVRIHENVSSWNGVIWNNINLIICVGDNFRESINIIGASSIESSVNMFIDDALPNNSYDDDLNRYITKKSINNKSNKLINMNQKNIRDIKKDNIKSIMGGPDLDKIKAIFVSRRTFKILAPIIILRNIEVFYTLLDNFGLAELTIPNIEDDNAVAMFITTVTRTLATTLFDDSGQLNFSSLWYSIDPSIICPILSLLESDSNLINKNPRILMRNVNINVNVPSLTENTLFGIANQSSVYINKNNNIEDNAITNVVARMVQMEVENSINNAIIETKNRTNNNPDVSIINSNITYRNLSKEINMGMQLTTSDLNYYVADSSVSNITLLDSHNSVIDVTSTEGSDISNGSKFIRYRCINKNYTHDRLDGTIFFINASKHDIIVNIPDFKRNGILWEGRIIKYIRIDESNNRVIIKNKAGLIDNNKNKVILCNKSWKNSSLELIIQKNGNAYVLGF